MIAVYAGDCELTVRKPWYVFYSKALFVFKKQSFLCFNDDKKKTIKIEMISTNIKSLN